ncbi:MAG: hypothetical protein AVDCRST_MAG79-3036, partial [uncultured Thermoleophilia bacterium]
GGRYRRRAHGLRDHPHTRSGAGGDVLRRDARHRPEPAGPSGLPGVRDRQRDARGRRAGGHGHPLQRAAARPDLAPRGGRRGGAPPAGGGRRRVPRRDVRLRGVQDGVLLRPGRQRPDAAPPLRAVRRGSGDL